MFKLRFITFALVLLGARVASAQVTYTPAPVTTTQTAPPPTHVTVVLPSSLSIGGQYYDASVSGVENFMFALHSEDPAAWAQLQPEMERLRERRNWAIGTAIAGNAAGLGLLVGSFFTGSESMVSHLREPNWAMMGIGFGVSAASTLVAQILWPRRADMMDFVNKHNRLRPASPMQLQLGVTATSERVACAATLTF